MTDEATAHLDAIRLARQFAADDVAAKPVVDELLERAPRGDDSDNLAARLFIAAVAECGVTYGRRDYGKMPPRGTIIIAAAILVLAVVLLWRG